MSERNPSTALRAGARDPEDDDAPEEEPFSEHQRGSLAHRD
jgi:hypothetical protein